MMLEIRLASQLICSYYYYYYLTFFPLVPAINVSSHNHS